MTLPTASQRTLNKVLGMTADDFRHISGGVKKRALLFEMWYLAVKLRDGFKCQLAGKDGRRCGTDIMQGGHLISRGKYPVSFDLRNGRCICKGHHRYYSQEGAQEWPEVCKRLWREDYEAMYLRRNNPDKTDKILTFIYLQQKILSVNLELK